MPFLDWFRNKFIENAKGVEIFKQENKVKFPCSDDNCLVRVTCKQACDKIIMDKDKLMKSFLKYEACPDCGSQSFHHGPSGGMAQNVKCAGCGHWFNLGLPMFIDRIHIDSNGRFRD